MQPDGTNFFGKFETEQGCFAIWSLDSPKAYASLRSVQTQGSNLIDLGANSFDAEITVYIKAC